VVEELHDKILWKKLTEGIYMGKSYKKLVEGVT
jgi:hypothetical protein